MPRGHQPTIRRVVSDCGEAAGHDGRGSTLAPTSRHPCLPWLHRCRGASGNCPVASCSTPCSVCLVFRSSNRKCLRRLAGRPVAARPSTDGRLRWQDESAPGNLDGQSKTAGKRSFV